MEKKIYLFLSALLFFVLFRWNQEGLAPDAALYAGLSLKVLQNQEFWQLSASPNMFPHFFEHPPYFFQWGSLVLSFLGQTDGAARAIGAIPSLFAFLLLIAWVQKRLGLEQATLCFFMLLSFGHFTKYAANPYLEGPLSAGVVLALISTYEIAFHNYTKKYRTALILCAALGTAIACAAKGVAGLGVWGAIFLYRWIYPKKLSWSFVAICLLAALSPMFLWAIKSYPQNAEAPWYFMEYLNKQVLRSFTTNRGSPIHSENGSRWTYIGVILKYGWPWWWTVPTGLLYWRQRASKYPLVRKNFGPWAVVSLLCFVSFFIPFSLSHFQLPHYLHPVYMPLAPLGAVFLAEIIPQKFLKIILEAPFRWVSLILLVAFSYFFIKPISSTPNRGQEFISVAKKVNSLNPNCTLYVDEKEIDLYRMESFSAWYFKNRPWKYSSKMTIPESPKESRILWNSLNSAIETRNCSSI